MGVNHHITYFLLEKAVSDLERPGRSRPPHANDGSGMSKLHLSVSFRKHMSLVKTDCSFKLSGLRVGKHVSKVQFIPFSVSDVNAQLSYMSKPMLR